MRVRVYTLCVSASTEISHVREMQFRLFAVWYLFVLAVFGYLLCSCVRAFCFSFFVDVAIISLWCSIRSYLSYYRTHFIHYRLSFTHYANTDKREIQPHRSAHKHAHAVPATMEILLLANVRVSFINACLCVCKWIPSLSRRMHWFLSFFVCSFWRCYYCYFNFWHIYAFIISLAIFHL